ncbi:Putative extradiol ring-cleavage dioxygenase, class III enzyme, subunit B [Colletotrichum destructivum]|uniref:Extradiol ring-cleavage dioxygenase, class III enzyme, subunit B n=1 Tax=Colletotrichum destructivum TaxID=34406 RepID=A0AAX4J3Z6_9PEZI|nr:Putative extradiol ring-cleavage dioxygenase, class III enzyme, subunit B [Colletotrichum destructivum]
MARAPVICITHGGGPMPIVGPVLGDKGHGNINATLSNRVPALLRLGTPDAPKAIVVVTPHWRPDQPTVTGAAEPPLYHDFEPDHPPQSWNICYKAPGSPEIADKICELLRNAGLPPVKDVERGRYHGFFVPFLLINPKGDIPLVQHSILSTEDPVQHHRIGEVLAPLTRRKCRHCEVSEIQLWSGRVREWIKALADAVLNRDPKERLRKL